MSGLERLVRFIFGLVCALLLQLLPLPWSIAPLRPMWLPLVLVGTALADVEMPVLLGAFLGGLASDLLLGVPLGEHALALVGLVYLIQRLRSSLIVLPLWQATMVLVPVWALYAFALFWLDGVEHHPADTLLRWMPVASTTAAWPFLAIVFGSRALRLRRRGELH